VKQFAAVASAFLLIGAVVQAHIMVSPPESKAGATQNYELRVHNEAKIATTEVDLQIPDGITIVNIVKPESGSFETQKTGDRITTLSWKVDVPSGKYVALKFSAKNPATQREVSWNARQHLADGSIVEWSDKPGAKEKASVTKIGVAASPASEGSHGAADHDHDHPSR